MKLLAGSLYNKRACNDPVVWAYVAHAFEAAAARLLTRLTAAASRSLVHEFVLLEWTQQHAVIMQQKRGGVLAA
jgi:hypothetical protein